MDPLGTSKEIYERLVALGGARPPRMRAWNGDEWGPPDSDATVVLQHPGALRALLLPPRDLTAGEAYIYDDVDIEGDLFSVLGWAASLRMNPRFRLQGLRFLRALRSLPAESRRSAARRPRLQGLTHSLRRDRAAVTHHYDTGNDFFARFLGPTMVYSCAYFLDPGDSLDKAQQRKVDLICRKLQLGPGDRFIDIGCGWGSLVMHAAREYGVEAIGVTLSGEQAAYAQDLASELGVADRVTILHGDYREVDGHFDAIASVGMFEHVGRRQLLGYFRHLRGLLAPGGALLNHGIVTRTRSRDLRRRPTFVSTYVFPDGELEPIDFVIGEAEASGFELRDAESLRSHYALTLRHWVANLESNEDEAVAASGELIYRIWRLYMAGSAITFEVGGVGIFQALFTSVDRPTTYGRRYLLSADEV